MKQKKAPYIFDEFFASGKEATISPFLTPSSKSWGKNLSLKSALVSAGFLLLAYITSAVQPMFRDLPLLFVYFLSGTPALIDAAKDIKKLDINIDILMTLAALLSILIGSPLEGALLLVLFELSAAIEESVAHKTKGALVNLHELSPRAAFVIDEGDILERSVREILPGMKLLIKAGEIVPLDSKVIAGSSFVNLKHLTGESEPIPKHLGDELPAGARNLDGMLTVEVLRSSRDSTLNRIIQLITQAQEAKPRLEQFLNRFGKWYAITIISLSLLFALIFPFFFGLPFLGPEGSIYRSLAFLIAASPCALIIATPTAYLSAISSCAKRGILLKGGIVFDALTQCKSIAFDKTGTLTSGKLYCTEVRSLAPLNQKISLEEASAIAATLEQSTTHPIGEAICRFANEKNLRPYQMRDFRSFAGLGVEATVSINTREVFTAVGNSHFINEKLPAALKTAWLTYKEHIEAEAKILAFLLIDNELFLFTFTDEIRPEAAQSIAELNRDFNLQLLMLSGDRANNAHRVASIVGIQEVSANLRPEDKLNKVAELSKSKGLIMIGDGINDAPALARATVGIALGKIGSATAIEASDIVFMNDDLASIAWLLKKAHKTLSIVKQNLSLSLGVILFATTPALIGLVPLWLAVMLHEGGTVLVGLNSLRLLKK
ncbi:MAG: cation-translocating P-type ATPase [Simkania sp.]|nr:cation-translocating P-type ATPase [Simkania sp.]